MQLVKGVVTGELCNGLALIRPPGHHAEAHHARGFCVINNVAVAASYARHKLVSGTGQTGWRGRQPSGLCIFLAHALTPRLFCLHYRACPVCVSWIGMCTTATAHSGPFSMTHPSSTSPYTGTHPSFPDTPHLSQTHQTFSDTPPLSHPSPP